MVLISNFLISFWTCWFVSSLPLRDFMRSSIISNTCYDPSKLFSFIQNPFLSILPSSISRFLHTSLSEMIHWQKRRILIHALAFWRWMRYTFAFVIRPVCCLSFWFLFNFIYTWICLTFPYLRVSVACMHLLYCFILNWMIYVLSFGCGILSRPFSEMLLLSSPLE